MLDVWLSVGVILAMGVFLLAGGPLRVASRARVFAAGLEAPGWLALATVWLSRGLGLGMILAGLALAGSLFWLPT